MAQTATYKIRDIEAGEAFGKMGLGEDCLQKYLSKFAKLVADDMQFDEGICMVTVEGEIGIYVAAQME